MKTHLLHTLGSYPAGRDGRGLASYDQVEITFGPVSGDARTGMLEASLLELGGTRSITGNALGTVTATANSFATRYDFVE